MRHARSRAIPQNPQAPARGRVTCTLENTSAGDHVIYGGPFSNFDCEVIAIIGDVVTCKAIRSGTEFASPISKLSHVEREAT